MDTIPQDNTLRKQCTGICGRFLPNTTEFFHRNGNNRNGKPAGLRPECKECRGKKVKAYYEQPETHEQRVAYTKSYRAENQEYIRAHKKAYYSQPEVQEQTRNRTKNYRQVFYSLPGKLEHKREQAKEYNSRPDIQARRRPYDRTQQHNRRARIKGNGGSHTSEQIQEQLQRQKGKCYYCKVKMVKYHIEHVIPVARGGSNDISNIVLACPSCNCRKNDRMPHEWPEGGRLL